jgi:hypothetical protein
MRALSESCATHGRDLFIAHMKIAVGGGPTIDWRKARCCIFATVRGGFSNLWRARRSRQSGGSTPRSDRSTGMSEIMRISGIWGRRIGGLETASASLLSELIATDGQTLSFCDRRPSDLSPADIARCSRRPVRKRHCNRQSASGCGSGSGRKRR